ncbi:hypothetical protein EYF80_007997 [Liparis tanakae]|uniref:Uncharacterized protein n=1 Tax=Liparis tanakae TaxID=230148 RepID=A0A4Z2IWG5_9TELE|nr:hypothetical protein EYF80_007997 [Liparis tanakae]
MPMGENGTPKSGQLVKWSWVTSRGARGPSLPCCEVQTRQRSQSDCRGKSPLKLVLTLNSSLKSLPSSAERIRYSSSSESRGMGKYLLDDLQPVHGKSFSYSHPQISAIVLEEEMAELSPRMRFPPRLSRPPACLPEPSRVMAAGVETGDPPPGGAAQCIRYDQRIKDVNEINQAELTTVSEMHRRESTYSETPTLWKQMRKSRFSPQGSAISREIPPTMHLGTHENGNGSG